MTETRFSDFTLSEPILLALQEIGYENPTPVQESSIPLVASGRDVMVQSQTGTGKTAAFGIPVLEAVTPTKGVKAIVLCPTRELAKQVAEELERIGRLKQVRTVAVYGGASMDKQVAEMTFAHVIAGTPGRVLDHLKRGTLKLSKLQLLVLDEADEMLSMGFARELEEIMSYVPKERQTLLFSATIPPDIKRYASRYMNEPEFLSLIEENVASDDVTHQYFMVSGVGRPKDLLKVIEMEEPESAIIFGNTRKDTELVAKYLQKNGIDAEYLNSDLSQRDRERIMQRMKDKNLRFLVATDIAARGIDISELSHVINYVLPESPEVYIHRTGRTGRAGIKGTALSLIGPREIGVYYYLRRIYKVALEERSLPTKAEIELQRSLRTSAQLAGTIRTSVSENLDADVSRDAAKLLERDDAMELVSILLHHFKRRDTQAKKSIDVPKAGGLLKDVPKPERIAPGALPQTLADVASRVAVIRGEFRGVEKVKASEAAEPISTVSNEPLTSSDTTTSKAAPEVKQTSQSDEKRKPQRNRTPKAVTENANSSETETTTLDASSTPTAAKTPSSKQGTESPSTDVKASKSPAKAKLTLKERLAKQLNKTESSSIEATAQEQTSKEPQEQPKKAAKLSLKERLAKQIKEKQQSAKIAEFPPEGIAEEAKSTARTSARKSSAGRAKQETPPRSTEKTEVETNTGSDTEFASTDGTRVFINVGRKDGYNAQRLRDMVAELGGLLPEDIFSASIRPRFSFLTVDPEYVDDLLEAINGERVKGRQLRLERARDDA